MTKNDNAKLKDEKRVEEKLGEEDLGDEPGGKSADTVTSSVARIAELEDQLKRAVADYRNLENRNKEERIEFVKFANKHLIESLLPALDTLLLAEKYTDDQNLKITAKHVLDVLKNAGVERIETVGREYDPSSMEAIDVGEGKENEVIDEAQPGFTLNGKIIRAARVKVGGTT